MMPNRFDFEHLDDSSRSNSVSLIATSALVAVSLASMLPLHIDNGNHTYSPGSNNVHNVSSGRYGYVSLSDSEERYTPDPRYKGVVTTNAKSAGLVKYVLLIDDSADLDTWS